MCGGDCGKGDGVCVKCILLNILKKSEIISYMDIKKTKNQTKTVDKSEKITYNIK